MRWTGVLLLVGVVVGAAAALSIGAVTSVPAQGSSEVGQLKSEIATLRQRVETLEQRLNEALVPALPKGGRPRPDIINPYPWPRVVPPNWKRFEFNGMPYYIVPIDTPHANDAQKQVPPNATPVVPGTPENAGQR